VRARRSNRWGPSSRCTGRTYRCPTGRPADAGDQRRVGTVDRHPEPGDPQHGAPARHLPVRDRAAGRRQDEVDREPGPQRPHHLARLRSGRGDRDERDPADSPPAQHVQDLDRGRPVTHLDHGHGPVAPDGGTPSRGRRPGRDRDQGRDDQDAGEQDPAAGPGRPGARQEPGGHPEHGEVAQVDVADREGGRPGRDPLERRGAHPGGQVEDRGDPAARDAGDQAGRHPPGRERRGERGGDDVRGQRGEGHGAERRHQDRGDADLGGDGEPERLPHPPGSRHPRDEARGEEQHAEAGGDAQPEPHRAGEEGVDEEQRRDGDREVAQPAGGPTGRDRPEGDDRHGGGAQHGRLEAGHGGEADDQPGCRGEAGGRTQAAQERSGDGEEEHDVGAGDDEQVREPGGAEVGGELGRLPPVVADGQAGEERGRRVRQAGGAPIEEPADRPGRPGVRRGRPVARDRVDAQPPGEVAGLGPRHRLVEGLHLAADQDGLAG